MDRIILKDIVDPQDTRVFRITSSLRILQETDPKSLPLRIGKTRLDKYGTAKMADFGLSVEGITRSGRPERRVGANDRSVLRSVP